MTPGASSWTAAGCGLLLAGACGGSDGAPRPSTEPIPAVTGDRIFVVDGGDASLTVIDPATDEVVGRIQILDAAFPHHVYASPDRRRLAVSIPGVDLSMGHHHGGEGGHGGHQADGGVQGSVLVLDSSTGETLASTWLPEMNHNAAFSPDGTEVWTTQMGEVGSALALAVATLDTIDEESTGSGPSEVTFSADGRRAFVANTHAASVVALDVATRERVGTVLVGDAPVGAWPGDDNVMYVDCEASQDVYAIDAASLEVLFRIPLGFTPGMSLKAPSGEIWATDSDAGRVVFYSPDDRLEAGEVATGAGAHAIAFSGDGARAYITNQEADTVTVVDVATHEAIGTIAVGSKPNGILYLEAP
ncbi:MAG TPA: YncE family protein [Kofleriaceae bacterium]|nr:YncE family protein [Kofleriaceae bacterium]